MYIEAPRLGQLPALRQLCRADAERALKLKEMAWK